MARIKVLLVLEASEGGACRHVVDLVCGLDPDRYAFHVLISTLRSNAVFPAIEKMRAHGARIEILQMRRGIPGLRDIRAYFRLRKLIRKGEYQVLHLHSSKAGLLGRLAVRRGNGPEVLYTPHCFAFQPFMGWKRRFFQWIELRLGKRTDGIICVSEGELELAREIGLGEHCRLHLCRNGVKGADYSGLNAFDSDKVLPELEELLYSRGIRRGRRGAHGDQKSEPESVGGERPVIVTMAGRMVPQKGWPDLIRLASFLERKVPGRFFFLAVGEGPQLTKYKHLVHRAGLKDRFYFTGLIGDIREILAVSDVLLNLSAYEGLAYILLEGMVSGIPVMAMDIPGNQELIEHAMSGLLLPVNSTVSERASMLLELTGNPSIQEQLTRRAIKRIDEQFPATRFYHCMDEIYLDHCKNAFLSQIGTKTN